MSHESDLKSQHELEDARAKADELAKPKRPHVTPEKAHGSLLHHLATMVMALGRAVHGGSFEDATLADLIEDTPEAKAERDAKAKAATDARTVALADAKAKDKAEAEAKKP